MSKYRTEEIERLAGVFGALSNPNRAKIFLQLATRCSPDAAACTDDEVCACVGELGRDLGIAQSTVSHHIKELHRAGLIEMERCGRTVRCWVDAETVREVAEFFGQAAPESSKITTRK
jgi:ArsR family transcriptional regulator